MRINLIVFLMTPLCFLSAAQGPATNALLLTQTIALPNVEGGLNHMSVDAEDQRLFAGAPTNKTLEIVDLKSGKSWRSLEGERPAAARYAPEFNQLYVSSGQSIYIYDGRSFALIVRIDLESRLDELEYNAHAKELYVGCMTPGKTGIAVIAIPEGRLLGKIAFPASPQGIAFEDKGARILANVPAASLVEVVDRKERKIVATWRLEGLRDNFPMALDEAGHRLFLACRRPAEMLALDTESGRIVARIACVSDADDMSYDPVHKRIYISGGEGSISVVEQQDADRYRLLGRVSTAPGAATSTFSGQLNSLYVGVPRHGDEAAEIRVFKVGR
jgi:hypothetical protein